jgi:hypothetical protein
MEKASEQHREAAEQHTEKERIERLVVDTISVVNNTVRHNPLLFRDSHVFELERKVNEIEGKQEKEVFTMLLKRLRKHPEQFLQHLSEFTQKESMQEIVFDTIVKTIGQTNPERGFQLMREDLLRANPDVPAENLVHSERHFHEQMAQAAFVGSLEQGNAYTDTHIISEDDSESERLKKYRRELFGAKYSALEIGKLEHALALHKYDQEIERKLKPDNSSRYGHDFKARVAKKMLDIDIERAIEIHEQFLASDTMMLPRTVRENFAIDVKEARVKKLLREGDVLSAREKIRALEQGGKPAEKHRASNLLRQLKEVVEKTIEELYLKSTSIKAPLSYYRTLPEDFPNIEQHRKKVLECLYVEASENVYEAGQKFNRRQQEEKKEAIGDEMKRIAFTTAPELLLPGAEGLHTADDRHWLDRYKITLRRVEWTAIAFSLKNVPERQEAFALIPAEKLLFGKEDSKEEKEDLLEKLFRAQLAHNVPAIAKGLIHFGEKIEALEYSEQMKVVDVVIKADPVSVFEGIASMPPLLPDQEGKLIELVGERAAKDLIVDKNADVFQMLIECTKPYQHLSLSKAQVIEGIAYKRASFVYEYLYKQIGTQGKKSVLEHLEQETLNKICFFRLMTAHCDLRGITHAQQVFGVEEFNSQAIQKGVAARLASYIGFPDKQEIQAYFKQIPAIEKKAGVEIDLDQVAKELGKHSFDLLNILDAIGAVPELKGFVPWGDVLVRIEKLQARAANEDNDPWETDLEPLVETLEKEKVLSMSQPEDGELLVEFVKTYGMVNAPKLACVFIDLKRAAEKEDLTQRTADLLIGFIGERKFERLERPADLLNELQRVKAEFSHKLLEDKEVPLQLETELGKDAFGAMIGKGSWERGDRIEDLVGFWEKEREKDIESSRVPEGYQEFVLSVPALEREVKTVDAALKQERRINKVVKKPGVQIATRELFDTFFNYGMDDSLVGQLREHRTGILEKIDKKLKSLSARSTKVEGKALEGIAKAVQRYQEMKRSLEGLNITFIEQDEWSTEKEKRLVALMQEVAVLDLPGSVANDFLRLLSVSHIKIVAEGRFVNWDLQIQDLFSLEKESFEKEDISEVASIVRQFISEHYLHKKQEHAHTGHTQFPPTLLRKLVAAWGLIGGVDQHIVCRADRTIKLIESNENTSGEMVSVAAVPGHGVMRIFSGDTGNACYTSRHSELAKGEYPDLHAFTFVTGRNTHKERFVGSTLAIETQRKNEKKKTTLIVRANNPRENLIQNVDAAAFMKKMLEEMILLAKRRGLAQVVIPLDSASASCSNREHVADFYHKYFGKNPKVPLLNTPETNFNSYPVYDPLGDHPCVVIWDKEHGKIGADGWGDISGEDFRKEKAKKMKAATAAFSRAA